MSENLFENNLKLAKMHEPECIKILQNNLKNITNIEVASLYDDINHAIDLIIILKGSKVQIRVRMPKYQNMSDFTVQISKVSGTETEMEKFLRGDIDWYLLCWTDSNEKIFKWILIDMHKILEKNILTTHMSEPKLNKTNGQYFVCIDWFNLENMGCLVNEHNMYKYNTNEININGINILQF